MDISFVKMHGLGNDFVILDGRGWAPNGAMITPSVVRALSDRRRGIGCDQLIVLTAPRNSGPSVHMAIFNQDGTEVEACGNATRCVAYLLTQENGTAAHIIETTARVLNAVTDLATGRVQVNFGAPTLTTGTIPLSAEVDTLHLPITHDTLTDPVGVGVPNPHMVFFVYDVDTIDLESVGAILTHHPLYPNGANVEIVQVVDTQTLRMRVYERGTGVTPACGTGAMAAVVAAVRRGLVFGDVTVILDGGTLSVTYDGQSIHMGGDVHFSYRGVVDIL